MSDSFPKSQLKNNEEPMTQHIDPREIIQLRVLADVLELRHVNGVPSALLLIPMTLGDKEQRYIATGTKAEMARLLELAPASTQPEQARESDLFEAWMKRQGHDVISRLETGGKVYVSSFARHAWTIWQGRAALAIPASASTAKQPEGTITDYGTPAASEQQAGTDLPALLAGVAWQAVCDAGGRPDKIEERLRAALTHRATTATTATDDGYAYDEACNLAKAIYRQHYREGAENWRVLPDLRGVISQISNMVAGMTRSGRATTAAPEPELIRAGWFLYEGIAWIPTSSDDPRATILYRKADRATAPAIATTATDQQGDTASASELVAAADAVVERWHSRDWKQSHTRNFIDRLAAAVGAAKSKQGAAQAQAVEDARDAARYRVIRTKVLPADVVIQMKSMPPKWQTTAERIDMLCDQEIAAMAAPATGGEG